MGIRCHCNQNRLDVISPDDCDSVSFLKNCKMEKYLENQKKILKNLIKCFNLIEKKLINLR